MNKYSISQFMHYIVRRQNNLDSLITNNKVYCGRVSTVFPGPGGEVGLYSITPTPIIPEFSPNA